ncbi:multiple antibiotic resistance protein [Roseateles sp. YR242]|uniref:MarC family protein n=1 Tax=Roseateles sp. YR242 TaxID=1855305 RepID=UPI0008D41C9F|nr:MarC family protein [Roseateles sp. YR242]SEK79264.1 multiple antibiotic resistance protein [Roseateles sp. YR242]
MATLPSILQALFLVPLTLLPIINPVGVAPIVIDAAGGDDRVLKRLSRQVAINGWVVIMASMLVGTYVLDMFGISLPVVRVAGGLLVAFSAWTMLTRHEETDEVQTAIAEDASADLTEAEIVRRSFFPITFPLTTGPGCIAAAIALGAQLPRSPLPYLMGAGIAAIGAAITAGLIYLVFRNGGRLMMRLGEVGTLVMMRLMAFVLLCIGIQILWTGWADLNGILVK